MIPPFAGIVYSFDKTPMENIKASIRNGILANNITWLFTNKENDLGIWDKYCTIDSAGQLYGIDFTNFIRDIYNGETQTCLVETIGREIGRIVYQIGDAVGLGDLGCELAKAVTKVFEFIGDFLEGLFGIIVTTTVDLLNKDHNISDKLNKFLTEKVSTEEQLLMYKEYTECSANIIAAMTNDEEGLHYIFTEYVVPLDKILNGNNECEYKMQFVFYTLWSIVIDMSKKYGLPIKDVFYTWRDKCHVI